MAVFVSDFDSEDVKTIQESESTIPVKNEQAEAAFDDMFAESRKAYKKLFSEVIHE